MNTAVCVSPDSFIADEEDAMRPQEILQRDQWVRTQFLDRPAKMPFSFVYDDQPSGKLMSEWPKKQKTKKLDARRTQHTIVWNDPNLQPEPEDRYMFAVRRPCEVRGRLGGESGDVAADHEAEVEDCAGRNAVCDEGADTRNRVIFEYWTAVHHVGRRVASGAV